MATVNGTTITLEEVEAIRAESTTTDRDQFNRDLFQLIVEETVRQAAAAQYSIVEDPAAVDAQYDLFIAGIEAEGPLDEYLETNGITEETIRHVAFQQVILPEIQVRLAESGTTEEDIQAAYAEVLPRLSTVCTRHILVATEDEGLAVLDRLDGGEDFVDLAAELSIDTGSGAVRGRHRVHDWNPPPICVASYTTARWKRQSARSPDQSNLSFGYHVLIVDSRETPSLDEVRTDLTASLGADLFDAWVFEALGTADIVVTERYGTWQTEPSFGVVSPA